MRVGYVQMQPLFGRPEDNLARARELMAGKEADLWVLPELFSSGYLFTSRREAEELSQPIPDGEVVTGLVKYARETGSYVAAGLPERAPGGPYNSAVLVGPEGLVSLYRKAHLFYREKGWFSPGDTPFQVVEMRGARVGLLICFDHLFPEAARTLALKGAEIIAHPANLVLPGAAQLTMRVRALENRVFTVTANRIGSETRGGMALTFTGRSQIVSPAGEVLASSPPDTEEAVVVEIDPATARDKHITELNHLWRDRRTDLYAL